MQATFLVLSLLSVPLLAQVSAVPFTDSTDMVPAFSATGEISLPMARLKVDLVYPKGKKGRYELTVVFDPNTGHYFWHNSESVPNQPDNTGAYLNAVKKHHTLAYADPTGLVDFSLGMGLWMKVWNGKAGNLNAAVAASKAEVQQLMGPAEGRGYHLDYLKLPVVGPIRGFTNMPSAYKSISSDFMCEGYDASCSDFNNSIVSISKQGTNWRLVLRNRYDVEVIMDKDFKPVSTRQLTQPPPPKPSPFTLYK